MVIKILEYSSVNSYLLETTYIEKPSFEIDVAHKAIYVVHRALKIANLNNSQFTSSTKTKSEVKGGGRKPWKQKGTGNARAGSKRSPLWRGGGITFGPKPRIIYKKLNKKEKQLALRTLIYNKRTSFYFLENFEFKTPKTNIFLKTFHLINHNENILVIASSPNPNLALSIRNCKKIEYTQANELNITKLARANKILLEPDSFTLIKELYRAL